MTGTDDPNPRPASSKSTSPRSGLGIGVVVVVVVILVGEFIAKQDDLSWEGLWPFLLSWSPAIILILGGVIGLAIFRTMSSKSEPIKALLITCVITPLFFAVDRR